MAVSQIINASLASGVPGKANLPTGSVLQVVNVTYATQVNTASTSYTDTGLSASITPLFSTSKILVLVNQAGVGKEGGGTGQRVHIRLMRGTSQLFEMEKLGGYTAANDTNVIGSVSTSYLDSPATTSSTTYKTQFFNETGSGLVYVNWNNGTSTITLMEISA